MFSNQNMLSAFFSTLFCLVKLFQNTHQCLVPHSLLCIKMYQNQCTSSHCNKLNILHCSLPHSLFCTLLYQIKSNTLHCTTLTGPGLYRIQLCALYYAVPNSLLYTALYQTLCTEPVWDKYPFYGRINIPIYSLPQIFDK